MSLSESIENTLTEGTFVLKRTANVLDAGLKLLQVLTVLAERDIEKLAPASVQPTETRPTEAQPTEAQPAEPKPRKTRTKKEPKPEVAPIAENEAEDPLAGMMATDTAPEVSAPVEVTAPQPMPAATQVSAPMPTRTATTATAAATANSAQKAGPAALRKLEVKLQEFSAMYKTHRPGMSVEEVLGDVRGLISMFGVAKAADLNDAQIEQLLVKMDEKMENISL